MCENWKKPGGFQGKVYSGGLDTLGRIQSRALRSGKACAFWRGGLSASWSSAGGLRAVLWLAVGYSVGAATLHAQDADKMELSDPSCNTDQGVQHTCECRGGKPPRVMKVKGGSVA